MNVPPVAASRTEWRTCGPPGGYSLPICLNDSDTESSTRGSPIRNKVQMIIESLRSSQSSLEMADKIEGNVLSRQEAHTQVCKVAVGSFVGAKCKTASPSENQQTGVCLPTQHESSDSDSDDSVDRGIEEAILEYLKERDDHKRKAEPCTAFLQSSKIPRMSLPVPDVSKVNADSDASSIASSPLPKAENPPAPPALVPLKKYIKNKASLQNATTKSPEMKNPCRSDSFLHKCPLAIKTEEDSSSDSDDGIEEAIQRYQLERKEQQSRDETPKGHTLTEESDSTSDDGIEEAIRSYRLEQLKEKSVPTSAARNKKTCKSLTPAVGSSTTENQKKAKLIKRKNRPEKERKRCLPPHPSLFAPKKALVVNQKGKGNELLSFKGEGLTEQPAPALPKANTTAELMCAEAILDISKTVMPRAFHHSLDLNAAPAESVFLPSLPNDDSDESSVDSEEGIEQEIMKFLEEKAQMHKQPAGASLAPEPRCASQPEKNKPAVTQKKLPPRLTMTGTHKEENKSISSVSGIEKNNLKPSREQSGQSLQSQKGRTQPAVGLQKTAQNGDKSSSLDSDEDLDTAIKDLLKTKKKSKKKARDQKRKSRKCPKQEEAQVAHGVHAKKVHLDLKSKGSALKKVHKCKNDTREKPRLMKKAVSPSKPSGKSTDHAVPGGTEDKAPQLKDDSSSVDSDDSIEQEIRKFLAERASTADRSREGEVTRNGTGPLCTPLQRRDKQENQLAEIPRTEISPLSGQSVSKPPQDLQSPPTPADTCITPAGAQSRCLSPLEPADGAGAARCERGTPSVRRGDIQDATTQTPSIDRSRSEAIKWCQSLGLPTGDARSRTPFQITSSKVREPGLCPGRGANLKRPLTLWSARTSRAMFACPPEKSPRPPIPPTPLNLVPAAKQQQQQQHATPFTHNPESPGPRGETASTVHIPKDKSVFVELESDKTNHVQVQSRERREGKEGAGAQGEIKKENESMKVDDKDRAGAEDEFIDEPDGETGDEKIPGRKQGFSTL